MKNIILLPVLIALILFPSSGFGQGTISVKVYPEIKRQKIQSIGGNYCQTRYTNNAWDSIGEETLSNLSQALYAWHCHCGFEKKHMRIIKAKK
jgi:hypothetical protein